MLLYATAVWTGAVVLNVEDWQLPEEPKPQPVKAPVTKPVARPVPPPDGKEITIKLGAAYTPVSSTTDSSEIAVLKRSAEQLQKRLAGKSRFYVVFNANIKPTLDTIIEIPEGIRYALVRFGQPNGPYRLFLFEADADQKLLAVAQDVEGLLSLNRIYGTSFEVTRKDFTQAFPKVPHKVLPNTKDKKTYHAYQLPGPVFVVFADEQLAEQFMDEPTFTDFANRLQGSGIVQTEEVAPDPEETPELAPVDTPPARQSFKELVRSGTIFERMRRAEEEERRRAWEEMEGPWFGGPARDPDDAVGNSRTPARERSYTGPNKGSAGKGKAQSGRNNRNAQRSNAGRNSRNTQRSNGRNNRNTQRSRSR